MVVDMRQPILPHVNQSNLDQSRHTRSLISPFDIRNGLNELMYTVLNHYNKN